jgi:hypothetical protein
MAVTFFSAAADMAREGEAARVKKRRRMEVILAVGVWRAVRWGGGKKCMDETG